MPWANGKLALGFIIALCRVFTSSGGAVRAATGSWEPESYFFAAMQPVRFSMPAPPAVGAFENRSWFVTC